MTATQAIDTVLAYSFCKSAMNLNDTILIPVDGHGGGANFSRGQAAATRLFKRLFGGGSSYGLAFTEGEIGEQVTYYYAYTLY